MTNKDLLNTIAKNQLDNAMQLSNFINKIQWHASSYIEREDILTYFVHLNFETDLCSSQFNNDVRSSTDKLFLKS